MLEQTNQEQEYQSIKELKASYHHDFLQKYYTDLLNDENCNVSQKKYAYDMLIAINADEETKDFINKYWNLRDSENDVVENKIEFLHETVEYLRELVIEVADPSISMTNKLNIVRKVSNKDFLSSIRGRIRKRIERNEE